MRISPHSFVAYAPQDGYTLERVDVYGLVDGVRETVVISNAECYVARNSNPSFSASPGALSSLFLRLMPDASWLRTTRYARGCYLACRGPFRAEQGMIDGTCRAEFER